MNIISLDFERKRRIQARSQALVHRMASALLSTYAVNRELNLALLFGYEPTLSNEAAMTCWIRENLSSLDEPMAEAIFSALCERFQRLITRLPSHQQGGM